MIFYLADAQGRADPRTADVVEDPLFRRLVGARDDRILPLSSYYAAHYLDGEALLDQIEPVLEVLP